MKTVDTANLSGRALDWAIAKFIGIAMTYPLGIRDEDVPNLKLPATVYDTAYTVVDGKVCWRILSATVSKVDDCGPLAIGRFALAGVYEDGQQFKNYCAASFYPNREEAELVIAGEEVGYFEEWEITQETAGELIDKYMIDTAVGPLEDGSEGWYAIMRDRVLDRKVGHVGDTWLAGGEAPTRIEAAMRCLASFAYGEQMEIPEEYE